VISQPWKEGAFGSWVGDLWIGHNQDNIFTGEEIMRISGRAFTGAAFGLASVIMSASGAAAASSAPIAVPDVINDVVIGQATAVLDVDVNDFNATGVTDAEWKALGVHCVVVTPPKFGLLVVNDAYAAGCEFSYTPGPNFPGTDVVTYQLSSLLSALPGPSTTVTYIGPAAIKPTTTIASSTTVGPATTAVPSSTTIVVPTGLSNEVLNTTTTSIKPKVLAVTVSTTLPKVADVPAKGLPATGSNPAVAVFLGGVLLTFGFALTSTNRRRQLRR
jgi:LPXTG-motif cell wall-anchored protein